MSEVSMYKSRIIISTLRIFLRQGKMGGWREHFSEDDVARMAQAIEERLPGTRSKVGHSSWRAES